MTTIGWFSDIAFYLYDWSARSAVNPSGHPCLGCMTSHSLNLPHLCWLVIEYGYGRAHILINESSDKINEGIKFFL